MNGIVSLYLSDAMIITNRASPKCEPTHKIWRVGCHTDIIFEEHTGKIHVIIEQRKYQLH